MSAFEMLLRGVKVRCCCRRFSTLPPDKVSHNIRKHFLEYFINKHGHKFIPSSSVASNSDASVPFVNAGMCQFKNVFLGKVEPEFDCVANSQKCIRVGGKRDDLGVIGIDSHHHTFFEMLGNWSFGKYFKPEACRLAWDLLTQPPYSIPPHRLFVTYFNGSEMYHLPADTETRDAWLSIGLPPERVLPFGIEENFWEMGVTGPCGVCTEIHVAANDEMSSAAHMVNKGHPHLTELWNIVFITHNRLSNNSLVPLQKNFVDTGMGFERLVAVLQGKQSNYDTDLFLPLFDIIEKESGAPKYSGSFDASNKLDAVYRVVADYSRMIAVAVADNVYPENNHKLRRVLRKALLNASKNLYVQRPSELIHKLATSFAESMECVYPEIAAGLDKVKVVLEHEEELLRNVEKSLRKVWKGLVSECPNLRQFYIEEYPGLAQAYEYLQLKIKSERVDELPAQSVYYLFETYGLERPVIECLSESLGFTVDWPAVEEYSRHVKQKTREPQNVFRTPEMRFMNDTVKTDDSYKYQYNIREGIYEFPSVTAKVLQLVKCSGPEETRAGFRLSMSNGTMEVATNRLVGVITDITNFYTDAGGQDHDVGSMKVLCKDGEEQTLEVMMVEQISKAIIHYVKSPPGSSKSVNVSIGDEVILDINSERRFGHMRNHTASHLVLAALKNILTVTYCKSAKVHDRYLSLSFALLGEQFDATSVQRLESYIKEFINSALPVERSVISPEELATLPDVTFTPDENDPSMQIYLLTTRNKDGSILTRDPCCGTHVCNTKDIGDFCVTCLKSDGASVKTLKAATGQDATLAVTRGVQYVEETKSLLSEVNATLDSNNYTLAEVEALGKRNSLLIINVDKLAEDNKLPNMAYVEIAQILDDNKTRLRKTIVDLHRAEIEKPVIAACNDENGISKKFLVHYLDVTPAQQEYVSLPKVVECCGNIPVIVFAYKKGKLRCYCTVPKTLATADFNAKSWLTPLLQQINTQQNVLKNEDPRYVCSMVPKDVKPENFQAVIKKLINDASHIASRHFENLQTDDERKFGNIG